MGWLSSAWRYLRSLPAAFRLANHLVRKGIGDRLFSPQGYYGGWGGPGWQGGSRWEQVQHFKTVTYLAVSARCERVAALEPVVAHVREGRPRASVAEHKLAELLHVKSLGGLRPHEDFTPAGDLHPLVRLLRKPNAWDTAGDLWYELEMFLCLTGAAYLWCPPSEYGRRTGLLTPAELWVVPSHWMRPYYGPKGVERYDVYPLAGQGRALELPPSEVIQFKQKSPLSKVDGWSPLQAGSEWVDAGESVNRSRFWQFKNGAFPLGQLELSEQYLDPSDEDMERIYAKFFARLQGEQNYGRPIITPPGAKYTPLQIAPVEMAYVESLNQITEMTLALWRVPKEICGLQPVGSDLSWYAPMKQFNENALHPRLRYLGQVLTRWLCPRYSDDLRLWWEPPAADDPEKLNRDLALAAAHGQVTSAEFRASQNRKPFTPEEEARYSKLGQDAQGGAPGMSTGPGSAAAGGSSGAMAGARPGDFSRSAVGVRKGDWKEEDHPRADDGKFGTGPGTEGPPSGESFPGPSSGTGPDEPKRPPLNRESKAQRQARHEAEDVALQGTRDDEDLAFDDQEQALTSEEGALDLAEASEDTAIAASREAEDTALQTAREAEDAAGDEVLAQRQRQDEEIATRREREDEELQERRAAEDEKLSDLRAEEDAAEGARQRAEDALLDGPEAAEEMRQQELDADWQEQEEAWQAEDEALSAARDAEDEEVEAKHQSDAITDEERLATHAANTARRDKEDQKREAVRDKARDGYDREQERREKATARLEAIRQRQNARHEAEDARMEAARDKEDAVTEARREKEDAQTEARREKEDDKLAADRDREDARREKEEARREKTRAKEDDEIAARRDREDEQREAVRQEKRDSIEARREAIEEARTAALDRRVDEDSEREAAREGEWEQHYEDDAETILAAMRQRHGEVPGPEELEAVNDALLEDDSPWEIAHDPAAGGWSRRRREKVMRPELRKAFEESKHPRDAGKFSSKPGAGGSANGNGQAPRGGGTATASKPQGALKRAAAYAGSAAWGAIKKAGHKAAHLEHVAKTFVTEGIPARIDRIRSDKLRAAVGAAWWLTKLGTKAAFLTYTAGQNMAAHVARAAGATEEQAGKLSAICTALDLAGAKAVPATLGALGLGPVGAAVGSMVPLGSAAYLAYSTARRPVKVLRAAISVIGGMLGSSSAAAMKAANVRGDVEALLAAIVAHEGDELWEACLYVALDRTSSLREALALAEKGSQGGGEKRKDFREEDHPRADDGKFGSGGKGKKKPKAAAGLAPAAKKAEGHPGAAHGSTVKITPVEERAWQGQPVESKTKIGKQETGRIGEAVIVAWLKHQGHDDAGPMNSERTNFPIDLIEDHRPTEVKAGLASNSKGAQQWRLTFSQESKEEKALYETMTALEREEWNAAKQKRIHQRKEVVIAALAEEGVEVKPRTMTVIVNPDTQTADIYSFDGFHDRLGWSASAENYVGSVRYDHPESEEKS